MPNLGRPVTQTAVQIMPNLGQLVAETAVVTETAVRGKGGWARTNRRCGGIDTRKLQGQSQQQGGGRRRLHNPLRGDHLRRGPPIPGGPVEDWTSNVTLIQWGQPSSDAGGDTSTNNIRRGDTPTNKICRGAPRATHEQDRITNEMV